ncbi:hypothetical protein MNBD_GAMMA14-2036, partial [hydrothermal vent metagenome]
MHNRDIGLFAWGALRGYPTRTLLMLIAMAIGVAAVVMLTALGEGARAYVANQFSSLGTNLIIVIPGRAETGGVSPSTMMGETPRDLTLDDATALTRSYKVRRIAPINVGAADANRHGRSREVTVFGTTSELLDLRHWELAKG